jgi:hypothetical protein
MVLQMALGHRSKKGYMQGGRMAGNFYFLLQQWQCLLDKQRTAQSRQHCCSCQLDTSGIDK